MKTLRLKHDYQTAILDLEGHLPTRSHVLTTVRVSTRIITPSGDICAVFLHNAIPSSLYELAYELWKAIKELPSNRATAVGSRSLPRIKNNKTLGKWQAVPAAVLKILAKWGTANALLGYRMATFDDPCQLTPLSKRHPEMLDKNERLVKLVDKLHKQYAPTFYAMQRAEVERALLCKLWDTAYTTIYLAKNFQTAYHFDRGNLKGAMTAIMAMGNFEDGELVLPRWRIAFALRPGDLLLFDPQQLHGNLPFKGQRLSGAFYCQDGIVDCGE